MGIALALLACTQGHAHNYSYYRAPSLINGWYVLWKTYTDHTIARLILPSLPYYWRKKQGGWGGGTVAPLSFLKNRRSPI